MKKALCLFMVLIAVSVSLTACTKNNDNASSSGSASAGTAVDASSQSEVDSSAESAPATDSQGYQIEYTSVAQGYIDHSSIWEWRITNFDGFECMKDEYLFLPANTTIMCDTEYAVYCYRVSGDELILDIDTCEELGQQVASNDVRLNNGVFNLQKDLIVRFSVKGSLSDVKVYVPKELEDQVFLGAEEDFIDR